LAKAFEAYGKPKAAGFGDEYPLHRVRITKPFYLGAYEVTVSQFGKFVSDSGYKTDAERNKVFEGAFGFDAATGKFRLSKDYSWHQVGFPQGDDHPVVNVSHNDAVAFCAWLSRKEGQTYRLPTEAEWEYACRAGTTTRYYHGDDPEGLSDVGNVADGTLKWKLSYRGTITGRDGYVFTAPVGKYKANGFGLYDMHGNVREWCADWYDAKYYEASPEDDPSGPAGGSVRVFRGGGWYCGAGGCLAAYRDWFVPSARGYCLGFRLAGTVSSSP
jgi:formylglycine-generating enzyme required for sulfatase activity